MNNRITGNLMVYRQPISKQIFALLSILVILTMMFPGGAARAGTATGLDNLSYTEQEGWVYLDQNVVVTSSSNDWAEGYIDFEITSGGSAADQLRIQSSGDLSIVGDAVTWQGSRIGTIDPTRNGVNGQPLRINFSASLYNAGFETGDFDGWTVDENFAGLPGDTPDTITQSATVVSSPVADGSYAAHLFIDGYVTTGNGTAHGPTITSSSFYAQSGNQLSLTWWAEMGYDQYDVYGYVINVSTAAQQELFYGRGVTTDGWVNLDSTINSTVCPSGTCELQFYFICGTYDETGGMQVSTDMYIDGISVITDVATDAAVDYIVEHVEYQNTSDNPSTSKPYTLTMVDSVNSGTASATINVTGVNDPPTDISLSSSSIQENNSINDVIGTLSNNDPDDSSFTYTLVSGAGDTDNASFNISGTSLRASESFDYETKNSYSIRVRVTDPDLEQMEESFTITIINQTLPPTGFTNGAPSDGYVSTPYTHTFAANGDEPPTFSVTSGSLPTGLSLNGTSGELTGNPTTTGTYNFEITATNSGGSYAQNYSIDILIADTTTVISPSAASPVYGEPVYLTATVTTDTPANFIPSGNVQFYFEGGPLGSPVSLDGSGEAVTLDLHTYFTDTHLLVGSYTYSASYQGAPNAYASDSTEPALDVSLADTTITVTPSENPVVYGTTLVMTVTVSQESVSQEIPDGDVRMFIDDVPFASVRTLDSSGEAHYTVPYMNLWPGHHDITAIYTPTLPVQFQAGDNFASPTDQLINKADPIVTITSDVTSPVAGELIQYSVVISPSMVTQGIPSGSVQFYIDSNPVGSPVTLDISGRADCPETITLDSGSHSVTVGYSGDDYFNVVPTSPSLDQNVTMADTTVTIQSFDPGAVVVGQAVTVDIVVEPVAPAVEIPTGTFTVTNGTDLCTGSLDSSGEGTCDLSPTGPGTPNLTATYSGSGNYNPFTSAATPGPVVSKANSTVGITGFASTTPVPYETVTITFTVSPVAPGFGVPTGLVTIQDDNGSECSATVAQGHCDITFDQVGQAYLTASYEGDVNFNPSTSTAVAGPVVQKAPTTSAVVTAKTPTVFGEPVYFTATVTIDAPGSGSPLGMVQFKIDGADFGSPVALAGGEAVSQSTHTLAVGTSTIGAEYLGNNDFEASSAPTTPQVVNLADTSIALTSNQNPSPYGLPVMITATVSGVPPSILFPTSGTIQFLIDNVAYGAPVEISSSGTANKLLPYTALWVGTHNITAVYSGNASFNGCDNISAPFPQVVEPGGLTVGIETTVENPVFGQTFAMTATVVGIGSNNPRPSGAVQFNIDGVPLGTPETLDADSSALSQSFSHLDVGFHDVIVEYSGDDYYEAHTQVLTDTLYIAKANSGVSLIDFSPAAVVVGQQFTVTYTSTAVLPGVGVPTGTVTVTNGVDSCSGTLADGFCLLLPSTVSAPDLDASYAGNDNFNSSATSVSLTGPVVNPANLHVTITDVPTNTVFIRESYTVTTQLSSVSPSVLIPVGTAIIVGNGVDSCTAFSLPDGSATCQIVPTQISVGNPLNLLAAVEGGINFIPAVSSPVSGPSVVPGNTSLTLTPSANPLLNGNSVYFTASLQVQAPAGGSPTGEVQFIVDDVNFGDPVTLSGGVAVSESTSALAGGLHTVEAQYLGSTTYITSTSALLSLNVVGGGASVVVTPADPAELVFSGNQGGAPVTTTLTIPSGAVNEDMTLVFEYISLRTPAPPEGFSFISNFAIRVYVNGVYTPTYEFNLPIDVDVDYAPGNWDTTSMDIFGWDGSAWNQDRITLTEHDVVNHQISFELSSLQDEEFALIGSEVPPATVFQLFFPFTFVQND